MAVGALGAIEVVPPVASHRDVLIPLLLLDWTAIDFKANTIALDHDLADAGLVSGLDGRPRDGEHALQFFATRREFPVFEHESPLSHGEWRADIHQFRIEATDQVHAGPLGNLRWQGRFLAASAGQGHKDENQKSENRNIW